MTYRSVCNQTTFGQKRDVTSESNETQEPGVAPTTENSPNQVGYSTVADDGTPIVYKSNDHRACPIDQYDLNPIP